MTATGHKATAERIAENIRKKAERVVVEKHHELVADPSVVAALEELKATVTEQANALTAAIEQIRHLTQALHELQHDHEALKAHTAGLAPMAHYHDFEVKDGKVSMKGAA